MDAQKPYQPFGRIQQLRMKQMKQVICSVIATQKEIPLFIRSLENISKKKKTMLILFTTLLVINLVACSYQTVDRILNYMDEPTTVNTYMIETPHGPFPSIYVYPETTQELNNYLANRTGNSNFKQLCYGVITHLFKTMYPEDVMELTRKPSYITDAHFYQNKFLQHNSRFNVTVKNHESIVWPIAQISSTFEFPYGSKNNKMVIKFNFPKTCRAYKLVIDTSPVIYHISNAFGDVFAKREGLKNQAIATVQKYHFINTTRQRCNNNLHDCLQHCLVKAMKCRFPFYEARSLPKCNKADSIHQRRILHKLLLEKDLTTHCKCLNLCDVTQQSLTYNLQAGSEDIVEIFVANNYVRTMQESFSYDIIFLLCDIGGNISLYFGMSCLALVEIFIHCCKMCLTKFSKTTKENGKLKEKIPKLLKKIQKTKEKSIVKNKLKTTVSLILFCTSVYQTYNLIDTYFQCPLTKTVNIIRDNMIEFPLVIACGETVRILKAKIKLAAKMQTDCGHYQLLDLLHPSAEYANETEKLWSDSSGYNIYVGYGKGLSLTVHDVYYANLSILSTAFGTCTVFNKGDRPFSPKQNRLLFAHDFRRDICNEYQTHFIVPKNQAFHPKYIFHIPTKQETTIDISRQTLVRVNTAKSPCKPNKEVSECEHKCFATKLSKQLLKCRLPFMKNSTLELCMTPETAKTTYETYLHTQFKTNPQKDCSCATRCRETVYNVIAKASIKREKPTSAKYTIEKNIREVIEEQELISVTKLLCSIGSIIGILTGFSTFTLIDYFI